jgi:hypothetical protein
MCAFPQNEITNLFGDTQRHPVIFELKKVFLYVRCGYKRCFVSNSLSNAKNIWLKNQISDKRKKKML